MPPDPDTNRSPDRESEAERYRTAAESALDQLDWCVAYLHRIRKPSIAAAVARNRTAIRRRLK